MDIDQIKSLYAEFIGMLSQTPKENDKPSLRNNQIWEHYNNSVKKLSERSGKDYSSFSINVEYRHFGDSSAQCIDTMTFRMKMGALISKLHAEYFDTLPEPFSGKPSIVINQTQQQNQQMITQLVLDVQSKIDEKLKSLPEGSKEKSFFQKLKGNLSTATSTIDLLNKIFILAKECGVQVEQLQNLFR